MRSELFKGISEHSCIDVFNNKIVSIISLFKANSLQDGQTAVNLRNSCLYRWLFQVDLSESLVIRALMNVFDESMYRFEAGLGNTGSTNLCIQGLYSLDAMFNELGRCLLVFGFFRSTSSPSKTLTAISLKLFTHSGLFSCLLSLFCFLGLYCSCKFLLISNALGSSKFFVHSCSISFVLSCILSFLLHSLLSCFGLHLLNFGCLFLLSKSSKCTWFARSTGSTTWIFRNYKELFFKVRCVAIVFNPFHGAFNTCTLNHEDSLFCNITRESHIHQHCGLLLVYHARNGFALWLLISIFSLELSRHLCVSISCCLLCIIFVFFFCGDSQVASSHDNIHVSKVKRRINCLILLESYNLWLFACVWQMLHHLHMDHWRIPFFSHLDFNLIHGACDHLLGVPQDHERGKLCTAQSLQLLHALEEKKLLF